MPKEFVGDLHAYIKPGAAKATYPRIGSVFKDENGQLSIKIDSIPIAGSGWQGWCNVFERKVGTTHTGKSPVTVQDSDDIPF